MQCNRVILVWTLQLDQRVAEVGAIANEAPNTEGDFGCICILTWEIECMCFLDNVLTWPGSREVMVR